MPNNDYILRSDIPKAIGDWFLNDGDKRSMMQVFEDIPAADVEPVVRCKDCKHRDPKNLRCDHGGLERAGCIFPVSDNYFCAHGERKENVDD